MHKEKISKSSAESLEKMGFTEYGKYEERMLAVLHESEMLIRNVHRIPFTVESVPKDDFETFAILSSGNRRGIYKCDSQEMNVLLNRLRPAEFKHLIASIALTSPGIAESAIPKYYIEHKNNGVKGEYIFPWMDEYLVETYGVLIYMEQFNRIVSRVSGLSYENADLLRRGLIKKKLEEMKSFQLMYDKGVLESSINIGKAKELWDYLRQFSSYLYLKADAVGCATLMYRSAYLKAHYPEEYMESYLENIVEI